MTPLPTRTCIGCRTPRPADELRRVVRQDGELRVDRRGSGRGAWLCLDSPDCITAAVRRKAFHKAFRSPVSDAAIEGLQAGFLQASEKPLPDVRG